MTVYFVDEDRGPMKPFRSEIAALGYNVVPISYAEDALETLSTAGDIELAILDVMLGVRSSSGSRRFSPQATRDGSQTGLVLLDALTKCRPEIFPARSVLITHSTIPAVLRATREASAAHGIKWFMKSKFNTPYSFSKMVGKLMKDLR